MERLTRADKITFCSPKRKRFTCIYNLSSMYHATSKHKRTGMSDTIPVKRAGESALGQAVLIELFFENKTRYFGYTTLWAIMATDATGPSSKTLLLYKRETRATPTSIASFQSFLLFFSNL